VHAVEFRTPATCAQCDSAPRSVEENATGDLPYIPGLPTPIEDERAFRGMSSQFLESANLADVATVAVKYAELGLRALSIAAAMGERRISDWNDEKRQNEALSVGGKSRAKRK